MDVKNKLVLLLSLLIVANGETDKQALEEINAAIEKISVSLNTSMLLVNISSPDLASARKVNQELAEHGGRFYDGVKIFAESMYRLMRIVDNDQCTDDKIIKGLTNIKELIGNVQNSVNGLILKTRYEPSKKIFVQNIQEKVNDLQKAYDQFARSPNRQMKNALMKMCKKRNMESVLQVIHQKLVERSAEEDYELLDGGSRHELKEAQKWMNTWQGMFVQATLLRAACSPMYSDADKVHRKQFEEINQKVEERLDKLQKSTLQNGMSALPLFLYENWTKDGKELMKRVYRYLNYNFNPGQGLKWNAAVVVRLGLSDRSEGLYHFEKDDLHLVVGYGNIEKDKCDNVSGFVHVYKSLWCYRIGGLAFKFSEWAQVYDSDRE